MQVINEKQKCSLCGKMDMRIVKIGGEFMCIECFEKKYVIPEIAAEVEELVDRILNE